MTIRITWARIAAAVGGALLIVALVVLSGLFPLAASAGHWGITSWFLDFAKRRAVATHALGAKAPPFDEAMVVKGAGHYEAGCRPCHGAPGDDTPVIPRQMTPHPPPMREVVPQYTDAELHWIVLHGIKFTGMPAWPSQERDDEVWSVVAFLRRTPGLDRAGYEALVRGDETLEVAAGCARCHGDDGLGRGYGVFPKLAGQSEAYLLGTLDAYAAGSRHSGVMEPIAAALDAEARRALARWYAGLDPGAAIAVDALAAARGADIARRGVPAARIGACADCHGPTDRPRNPSYPRLAGQHPAYLELQLRLFQERKRGGTEWAEVMRTVLSHRLAPDQIRDVARYYASLPPGDTARAAGDAPAIPGAAAR